MEQNPAAAFIELIRGQASGVIPTFSRFGRVISADPLKVLVAKTVQTRADILMNPDVELHDGDTVFLIAKLDGYEQDQKFLLLCRVV